MGNARPSQLKKKEWRKGYRQYGDIYRALRRARRAPLTIRRRPCLFEHADPVDRLFDPFDRNDL